MSQKRNWIDIATFKKLTSWLLNGEVEDIDWKGSFPSKLLCRIAKDFGSKVFIGIRGGENALRNMSIEEIDSHPVHIPPSSTLYIMPIMGIRWCYSFAGMDLQALVQGIWLISWPWRAKLGILELRVWQRCFGNWRYGGKIAGHNGQPRREQATSSTSRTVAEPPKNGYWLCGLSIEGDNNWTD